MHDPASDPRLALPGEASAPGVINSIAYAQGRRLREVALDDISEAVQDPDVFLWIGLFEPSHELLRKVQEEFGLHELAVEDAVKAHQRPKMEQYGDSLFIVLRTIGLDETDGELSFGETHIFAGRNYVVTVRHGSARSHVGLRARCEAFPEKLAKGPGFVIYALTDFVVDQYFPVLDALEERFEVIEEHIFAEGAPPRGASSQIYDIKRRLTALKHALLPVSEMCGRLMKFDLDLVPEDINPYLRDVQDHVMKLNERIDNLRELLAAALDVNQALVSEQHTVHSKQLAAWAAIIAVPTMIAGVYGMNFENMPELGWKLGYPVAVGSMVGASSFLYWRFKRSGWL
jgi:magnesium transporter